MIKEKEWYLQAISHEIDNLDDRFTGNISFQFNIKEGTIANVNAGLGKSIKKIEPK